MKIDIITLFPEMFTGPFDESIIKRAKAKGAIDIKIHQLRDFTKDKHSTVDDRPYGGGAGMVMKVDVAHRALSEVCGFEKAKPKKTEKIDTLLNYYIAGDKKKRSIKNSNETMKQCNNKPYKILLTPKGKKFDQKMAQKLSKKKHLVFLCPHYEGHDHRIESFIDEKISIGDYILTGGEIPAMVIVDSVVRLIPGVIKAESLKEESFSQNPKPKIIIPKKKSNLEPTTYNLQPNAYLEYPQYTRPEIFEYKKNGKKIRKIVPKILLSGNHAEIKKWRSSKTI